MKISLPLFLSSISPLLLLTAAENAGPVSPETLVRQAHSQNPGLRASGFRAEGATERIAQARSLENPLFTYGHFIQRMNERRRFSLTQPFPFPGALSERGKMRHGEAASVAAEFRALAREVEYEVRTVYAEIALLDATLDLLAETVGLLEEARQIVEAGLAADRATGADLLRREIELARIEDERAALLSRRPSVVSRLNVLIGLAPEQARPILIPLTELDHSTEVAPMADALQSHPQIAAIDHLGDAARSAVSLSRREGLPGFSLGVEYMENDHGLRDEVMVRLGLSLPLWRERYRAAERQARAEVRQMEQARIDRFRKLSVELQEAADRKKDWLRRATLYREKLIPQARSVVEAEELAFRSDRSDLLRVIEARRVLLDLQRSYFQSIAGAFQADAALRRLIGSAPAP